jgi:hypothetical protein
MYIPQLNLQEYLEFVRQEIDCSNCSSIECLQETYKEAVKLNKKEGYTPVFSVEVEMNYNYPCVTSVFSYQAKPSKEDIKRVSSYNYRVIENYNQFINTNPKVAKALGMVIQKHEDE